MNGKVKPIQVILVLLIMAVLSGCSLGQVATPAAPKSTETAVSISAVMTSAAATAFVQLTQIAGLPSPTSPPSATPTNEPPTATAGTPEATATLGPSLQLLTPTSTEGAGGLPVVQTPEEQTPVPGGALPTNTAAPSLTPVAPVLPPSSGPTCLNAAFVADVTIPDKTVLKPGEKFKKIWRIQNTGTCTWDQGFGLVNWSNPLGGVASYYSERDQPVAPGGVVDMDIDMVAPMVAGDHIGHWVMVSDTGITFGTDLTVFIVVAP